MGTSCCIHARAPRGLVRAMLLGLLGLLLFGAGGCAMLPFALSTTASFAAPRAASLAMSGVKGTFQTAHLAADERDLHTIVRDNMLSLKGQSALLAERCATDVHVYAYNGDIFAVGVVDSEAQRDHVIRTLQAVKGTDEIKGVIRLRDPDNLYASLGDNYLENLVRRNLGQHLLHKNAGVDIAAVQGEICLVGVVGTHAEALDLIQYVESVSGARALSLLAIRDEYATGRRENNQRYLLAAAPEKAPPREAQAAAPDLPRRPLLAAAQMEPGAAGPLAQRAVWNKARQRMHERLQTLAKRELNPNARTELLTLASQIVTDHDVSIADRLAVAAAQAKHQHAKAKINSLLALF